MPKPSTNASFADRAIGHIDRALRVCRGVSGPNTRPNPANDSEKGQLSAEQQREVARLMRINHAGEVSAQALYLGQALTARDPQVRESMRKSAAEELDHLAWCEQRLEQLGDRVSVLNPLWYVGSLSIGALAGIAGDGFSLGFIAETENQVVRHLDEHLERLPEQDYESRSILTAMRAEEAQHGAAASAAGGEDLPVAVKTAMAAVSKIMTRTSYWL